jgi:glycosyltransferase involved in cell wall biosynthesis
MPIIGRHWPSFFKWDYISNFQKNKRITKNLVKKIRPDIIHLHGAENAYYSSTFIQFLDKYPTIFTLQGFISKSNSKKTKLIKKRIEIEKEIITKIKNAFYRTKTMVEDMKAINPDLNLFWNDYPSKKNKSFEVAQKKYDIVFFARITKEKGIEDLLQALSLLKKNKPEISLCVIGSGNIEPLKIMAKDLGIEENVKWAGFLPTQEDVHKLASQANISVLPTYHDIISGTILESMFLKLPVVAYNVGSIHEVNEKEEIISLVDKLDVEGLAKAIKYLLDNSDLRAEKAEKGYKRAVEMFTHSDEEIRESLLNAYHKVIEDFHKKDKKQ